MDRTPVMEMLDIWPAFFPIVVRSRDEEPEDDGVWNVGSARKHPDRVREIFFDDISSQIFDSEVFSSEIQGSFPVLTTLVLKIGYRRHFLFPEPFCHRSSPRLRSLDLDSIPFSAVHELLLSANGLVDLSLWDLPEYVSPEGIVPYLSLMAGLESMYIGFRYVEDLPHQERQRSYPLPSIVLPALIRLVLKSPCGYSEDLMARLGTSRLDKVLSA